MKVLFRTLMVVLLAVPLAGCSGEVGSLNKNQDPADEALLTEHDETGTALPADDPPP